MGYYSAVRETTPLQLEPPAAGRQPFWRRADLMVAGILLAVLLSAALTVDTVRNGYGLKGDEGTYTAAALSVAYDYDVTFERRDLERYWSFFLQGPDGAFLQRARGHYAFSQRFPFVRFKTYAVPPNDKLYFGKAFIYPAFAAPFVRLFGLNGFLVFHVLLLAGVAWCGYAFLLARSESKAFSAAFTLAFLAISIVPVYGLWLTPEIFNLALVFFAYFLWLYKEVAAPPDTAAGGGAGLSPAPGRHLRSSVSRFLFGAGSDVAAAALLGMVTFSKVLYGAPLGALLVWQLWKRRPSRGAAILVTFVLVVGGLFATNALISGEVSYQGGDRKVFYWPNMVFTTPQMTFDSVGYSKTTTEIHEAVFEKKAFVERLGYTAVYFLIGRHSGLVPYFFPGALALLLWLFRLRDMRLWQVLTLGAAGATVAVTVLWMPYTWSGGGGPPGNRYFLGVYPALFFLMPPFHSLLVPLLAWTGGALFTAQLVMNPYFTKAFPYRNLDHGALRVLPVELTMVNDLPVMLDVSRAPVEYKGDPTLWLYLLDENIFPPEPAGIWVKGKRRTDVVVRTTRPLSRFRVTLTSPVPNHVWLSFDGRATEMYLQPGTPMNVTIPTGDGVYSIRGFDYLLSVKTSDGMVPYITEPGSADRRYLGVLMQLSGSTTQPGR